jgi:formyltetrahydrofolate deformylase
MENNIEKATIMFHCKDRTGIVAGLSGIISELGLNVVEDKTRKGVVEQNHYFARYEVESAGKFVTKRELEKKVSRLARKLKADNTFLFDSEQNYFYPKSGWQVSYSDSPKKVALLVGSDFLSVAPLLRRYGHGLKNGTRFGDMKITHVISYSERARVLEDISGAKFVHLPSKNKDDHPENELIQITKDSDFIVSSLYYRILSPIFLDLYSGHKGRPVINLHPALNQVHKGLGAYENAHERGHHVGATLHFVTPSLDEGPVIYQESANIEDARNRAEVEETGMDVGERVLVEGMKRFLDNRVFCFNKRVEVL